MILIREPHGLLLSFDKALGNVTVEDTCLPDQVKTYHELLRRGLKPIVVVSEDLLENPEGILRYRSQFVTRSMVFSGLFALLGLSARN